jgi:hypothetical protein
MTMWTLLLLLLLLQILTQGSDAFSLLAPTMMAPKPMIAAGSSMMISSHHEHALLLISMGGEPSPTQAGVQAISSSLALSIMEGGGGRVAGSIHWENPAEAIGGGITLLYIAFSIWAGIKYVVKDGWRPPK